MQQLEATVMPHCGLTDPDSWPNSCNLNFYEQPADAVGPHADDEELFQGKHSPITIISLSLRGPRTLEIHTRRRLLAKIPLHAGDMLAMEAYTQTEVQHAIAKLPANSDEDPRRINLTWR